MVCVGELPETWLVVNQQPQRNCYPVTVIEASRDSYDATRINPISPSVKFCYFLTKYRC